MRCGSLPANTTKARSKSLRAEDGLGADCLETSVLASEAPGHGEPTVWDGPALSHFITTASGMCWQSGPMSTHWLGTWGMTSGKTL